MKSIFMWYQWCLIALLLSSCAGPPSFAQEKPLHESPLHTIEAIGPPQSNAGGKQGDEYAEGQVLVRFVEGTSKAAVETIMSELNLETIRVFSSPNLYLVRICDHTPVKTMLERLKKYPAVEHAEPNYAVRIE